MGDPLPKILISACLMGEKTRYDGNHNQIENEIIKKWAKNGQLVSICPEVLGGLPIPRPPCEKDHSDDLIKDCDGHDHTKAFNKGAETALELAKSNHAFMAILKEKSPSCGVHHIYDGTFQKHLIAGQGMTTETLSAHDIKCFNEHEISQAYELMNEFMKEDQR